MTSERRAPDPDIRLVTVLRTTDAGMVAIARSLLDDAGIDYFLRGETFRSVIGWGGSGVFGGALGEAEFQVRDDDAADAARLLARLDRANIAPVRDDDDEA